MLNRNYLVICLMIAGLTGCTEEKPLPVKKEPVRQKPLTYSTELKSSEQVEHTFKIKGDSLTTVQINSIHNYFGIYSVTNKDKKLTIIYDPAIFSIDSLRHLLMTKDVEIKE